MKLTNHNQIFQKKDLKDLKSTFTDQDMFDHQSKRMVSTSIFPPPSSIPRTFDINNLEKKIPRFWHVKKTKDGEILLTKEQVDNLKHFLIKEREEQLTAQYRLMMSEFVDRYREAQNVKALPKQSNQPNYSANPFD